MPQTYLVKPLAARQPTERTYLLQNRRVKTQPISKATDPEIAHFHKQLPDYTETKLHSLPSVAKELGFAHVFVKDESTRFGLPSFKMAGASWAIHKALCQHAGLPSSTSIADLRDMLANDSKLRLVTCTEGNWGRATARMAKYLGIRASVYVPDFMEEYTRDLIRQEGAEVIALKGKDYDEAMAAAVQESKKADSILVLDVALGDFLEIPQWVSDGYSIILDEVDRQVAEQIGRSKIDIVTCSVGAGSWAQAIVTHYSSNPDPPILCSVEPDAAASFKESLHQGEITPIKTGHTIMNGMNCGTVSSIAWPVLRDGVEWAIVVDDVEVHACVQELQDLGINAGPCGAANLAALRRLCQDGDIGDTAGKTVVIFSTEGLREYEAPRSR